MCYHVQKLDSVVAAEKDQLIEGLNQELARELLLTWIMVLSARREPDCKMQKNMLPLGTMQLPPCRDDPLDPVYPPPYEYSLSPPSFLFSVSITNALDAQLHL